MTEGATELCARGIRTSNLLIRRHGRKVIVDLQARLSADQGRHGARRSADRCFQLHTESGKRAPY